MIPANVFAAIRETDRVEEKSEFGWDYGDNFKILKILVGFANSQGGLLRIRKFDGRSDLLDAASLSNFINKYVSPEISGINTFVTPQGWVEIKVPKSITMPHVTEHAPDYEDRNGKRKVAFQVGQAFVRNNTKTEPGLAKDFDRMIRESVQSWLAKFAESISQTAMRMSFEESAIPVRLGEGAGAFSIDYVDPNKAFPYKAIDIGNKIGKASSWVGRAAQQFGWKERQEFCLKLEHGKSPTYLYSKDCLEAFLELLKNHPKFSPYTRDDGSYDSKGKALKSA